MEAKLNEGPYSTWEFCGKDRKELVKAIAEITESDPKYLGAPTFAYEIGGFTVTKAGTVQSEDEYELRVLIETLGLIEGTEMPETEKPKTNNLSISLPKEKFTPEVMTNFINLVAAKQELLKQALKTEDLSIIQEEDKVTFPWFTDTDPDATYAHMLLVTKMVEMATNQKRISAKQKEIVNPKYEFRCFLLRLGMIGDEYKGTRKVLLKNLSGSAAFKNK